MLKFSASHRIHLTMKLDALKTFFTDSSQALNFKVVFKVIHTLISNSGYE